MERTLPVEDRGLNRRTSLTGLFVLMCASVMTFVAIVSALVVRRGLGNDFQAMPLPWILWPNTALLMLSSLALDLARRQLRRNHRTAFNWFWGAGTLLGGGFLAGQIIAWRQLGAAGVYLASNASHSFFYVLTWTHAAHAAGGLLALLYVAWKAFRFELGPSRRTAVEVSTFFWHFLDVLWIFLMLIIHHYA